MTDFEAKGQAFWQWLEKNGATLSNGIGFKDYRSEGAGRGVVATRDIKVIRMMDDDAYSQGNTMDLTAPVRKMKSCFLFQGPCCYLWRHPSCVMH